MLGASSDLGAGWNAANAEARDLGADWDAQADQPYQSTYRRESFWTVLLGTFTQPGHQRHASTMLSNLPTFEPELANARVHTDSRGSMVIFGEFASADTDAAQRGLEWVKSIRRGDRVVFPRATLGRVRIPRDPSSYGPLELLSVRADPRIGDREVYSYQVGVWGVFDSRDLSWEDVRRQAEDDVRRLRRAGYPAFYYHREDRQLSTVTIGVFGRNAFDVSADLFIDPNLVRLADDFPAHLVNGEPLLELDKNAEAEEQIAQRADGTFATRLQTPKLVLIPDLP